VRVGVAFGVVMLVVLAACTGEPDEPSPAATAGATGEASPSSGQPSLAPGIAAMPICDMQTQPEGAWRCGTIEVPVDHEDPSAGTIALNVHVLPHADDSVPAGAPIFTLSGGPGANGFTYGTWSLPPVVNEHHDVVWLDQRGTGTSDVIDCPDLQDGVGSVTGWRLAVAACGEHLGDAADRYGTGDAALDLESIRQAFGYDTIILEGQSYGSITAQAYAARFPDRVEALVFDSGFPAVDPDLSWWFGTAYPQELIRIGQLLCDRDDTCDVDVDATFRWLVARVRARPVVGVVVDQYGERERVVVDEGMLGTVLSIGQDGGMLEPERLERVATSLRKGDPEPLLRLASETNPYPPADDLATFSNGASIATMCADNDFGWTPDANLADRRRSIVAMVKGFPPGTFAPFSAQGWARMLAGFPYQCLTWPPIERREKVVPGGVLPDVPTLIFAGDVDQGAVVGASELADEFPQATVVVVPGAGHNIMDPQWAGCTPDIVATFVDTLDPGDTSCATDREV